jgi:hypothetical protein
MKTKKPTPIKTGPIYVSGVYLVMVIIGVIVACVVSFGVVVFLFTIPEELLKNLSGLYPI